MVTLSVLSTGRLYPHPGDIPGTHFCWWLSRPQGHNAAGRIKSMKNSSDLSGNQTRAHPAGSAVPQPTTPLRTPTNRNTKKRSIKSPGNILIMRAFLNDFEVTEINKNITTASDYHRTLYTHCACSFLIHNYRHASGKSQLPNGAFKLFAIVIMTHAVIAAVLLQCLEISTL